MTHGVTRRAIFNGVLHMIDQVRALDFALFAAAAGLAHPRTGGIVGQLLEFSHALADGFRITAKDLGHVFGAAMAQLDGFHSGKTSAVFFR
jgi:hypothetical protein